MTRREREYEATICHETSQFYDTAIPEDFLDRASAARGRIFYASFRINLSRQPNMCFKGAIADFHINF